MHVGCESTLFKYLWFKTTLFRHKLNNAIVLISEGSPDDFITIFVNKNKKRKQGLEIEMKTFPVYNTSVFFGFVLMDVRDMDTKERENGTAKYTIDVGIQHVSKYFKASLKGHHINWNQYPEFKSHHNFIWDINLIKDILFRDKTELDLFLTVHNIFNDAYYLYEFFKNPKRWIEGGVRIKF